MASHLARPIRNHTVNTPRPITVFIFLSSQILRTLATQAMSNALYFSTGSVSSEEYFHYGLALDRYTHFTSPIRRYADVIVSRACSHVIKGLGSPDLDPPYDTRYAR